MLTTRWEPTVFFSRERSPSPLKFRRARKINRHKPVANDDYCSDMMNDIGIPCRPIDPESSDEFGRMDNGELKDRFIDLAQAALEEAILEEDQKGVLREMVEALIAKTGAPLMVKVLSEQLRSQEVIERLAESHAEQQRRMSQSTPVNDTTLKEPHHKEDAIVPLPRYSQDDSTLLLVSEYMWRLFRLLLLASLVGLVCHLMSAKPYRDLIVL
ncbi:hypothetical protein CLU79DRAFT_772558 [Phycomyces nitens]|nr:hypothetical protein CLU79DRAFT_772558 [Phycomyces nitens]